ncbi:MAG: type VI secretion system baseplate subunit TssF [Spirochaetaceae bacterium]|nr:type VI secretion system baseplate subunit TssF [Spirochaetaceae bacterium]
MDLLDYYRDNLNYIRGLSAEFAAEFPKIARRLLLSEFDCQDPYIERLLEGTAFLSAKVEKKLDEGYYTFLEAVLNSISPSSLYPIPAGAVLNLALNLNDESFKFGGKLKAGTLFETTIHGINTPCRFSCAEDTPLAPFTIARAEYINDVAAMGIKNNVAESALRIRFSGAGRDGILFANDVQVFINLSEADVSLLMRLLIHDVVGVYTSSPGSDEYSLLSGVNFSVPVMTGEKLFNVAVKSNTRGLRILQNFLTYPDFFKFFLIRGLASAVRTRNPQLDLIITFKRREQALAANIKNSSLMLNCVPVLNVFSKRSDRVTMGQDACEFHVVPDRTAMRDYEVVAIKNIDFFNERNELIFSAVNFYDETAAGSKNKRNFFSVKRRKKLMTRHSIARSTYEGTEVFVSFASDESDSSPSAYQFAADLLVTNRDLPLLLQSSAEFSSPSSMVQRAFFTALPTRPAFPLIEKGNYGDFVRLSHIVLNLSALLWQEGTRPLEFFKTALRSYPIRPAEEMERMIDGIVDLRSESSTFRFIMNGTVFYEWGWKVQLTMNETAYAGMGYYTFARILMEILMSFTPVNTFLEISFNTIQSGKIAVWKTSEA